MSPLRLVGVGWFIATCIVGGLAIGLWLDSKLGVSPLFLLLGLGLGLFVAFRGVYRMLIESMGEERGRKGGK